MRHRATKHRRFSHDRPPHRRDGAGRRGGRAARRLGSLARDVDDSVGRRHPHARRRLPRRRVGPAGPRRLARGRRTVRGRRGGRRGRRGHPRARRWARPLCGGVARRCRRTRAVPSASGARGSRRDRRLGRAARRRCCLGRACRASSEPVDLEPDRGVRATLVRSRLDRATPRADRPPAARVTGRGRRQLCALLRGARRVRRAGAAIRDRPARARRVGRVRHGRARVQVGRDRGRRA